MLASLLGLDESAAAEKLNIEVAISHDPGDLQATQLARQVARLLERTVKAASINSSTTMAVSELVIGQIGRKTAATPVFLARGRQSATISLDPLQNEVIGPLHPIGIQICACYAAAMLLRAALPQIPTLPVTRDIKFDLREWTGEHLGLLDVPVDIGQAYLAGAGAVGNGFAVGLACFPKLSGSLSVCDDDQVSEGNMQRCVLFENRHLNESKAEVLAGTINHSNPSLQSSFFKGRLQTHPDKAKDPTGRWLKTLIVGVDSPRARRELQREFPREVFDASTSGVAEIVFHHHRQPTRHACLACIYHESPIENAHEKHVAESLGVPVEFVKTSRVSGAAADLIASKFKQLDRAALVGMAYDTLFKQLCGAAELKTVSGKQVVTPFAFVSTFAGLVLALELVLRAHGVKRDFNEWRLSPWASPVIRRRRTQERIPVCTFCSNPTFRAVTQELWQSE
jgi:molybdopterin/thiamine biosynthesis adenylyltransferase